MEREARESRQWPVLSGVRPNSQEQGDAVKALLTARLLIHLTFGSAPADTSLPEDVTIVQAAFNRQDRQAFAKRLDRFLTGQLKKVGGNT